MSHDGLTAQLQLFCPPQNLTMKIAVFSAFVAAAAAAVAPQVNVTL